MVQKKEKFASQAAPELLREIKALAKAEGRQLQSVLEEAISDFIAKKKGLTPRAEVVTGFSESIAAFNALYTKLGTT